MNRRSGDDYLLRQIRNYMPDKSAVVVEGRIMDDYTKDRINKGLPISE